MNWRSRWIVPAFVVAGLIIGVGPAYAGQLDLTPAYWSAPIAVAGLVGAGVIGVRRSASDATRRRLRSAVAWMAAWAVLVSLPWAVRTGLIRAELAAVPVPPDAVPLGVGVMWEPEGFTAAWTTSADREAIEAFYLERLPARGWRHEWSRDLLPSPGVAPGTPPARWSLYRRVDGLMLVGFGQLPGGQTTAAAQYMHLRRSPDVEHLLAPPAKTGGTAPAPE